ncbi:MAG: D-alanine--D-alanine ligase family protein [bacterium]
MSKLRVAVLAGGISSEREISLLSGQMVIKHCPRDKYIPFHLDPREILEEGKLASFIRKLKKADVVFIALHGKLGEDGTIQGFLETLGIPYTGSDVLASALAMDKLKSKQLFASLNIPTPPWKVLEKDKPLPSLNFPVVVKPQSQGSSIGVTIVEREEELPKALEKAFQYDPVVIAEDFIRGREISVPILEIEGQAQALPVVEIVPKGQFYDYYHKYTEGATEEIVPAPLPMEVEKKVKEIALSAYKAIGCRNFARVDIRLNERNEPFVLEVNTIPGLTPLSLLPLSAKAAGISFPQLIDIIIQNSLKAKL